MAKCYFPLSLVGPIGNTDLNIQTNSGYYTTFEAGGVRPYADDAHNCGNASYRWALVRGVVITPGDIGFEEKICLKCGKKFNIGENIVLKVKGLTDWGGTLTIPIHLECASDPKVKRKVTIPKFEFKHAFANGKHIIEQCPVKTKKRIVTLQIKKDSSFEIAHLDEDTGVWRRIQIGNQTPNFFIGEVIPETEVLEEIEVEKEEVVYDEIEIEI